MSLNSGEDWWITPEGSWPMLSHEHYVVASRYLLKMKPTEEITWKFFGEVPAKVLAAAKKRGVEKPVLDYLARDTNDPRTYCIVKYGWVRVAKDKMQCNKFDEPTLTMIQRAKPYWDAAKQYIEDPKYEMITIDELTGDKMFSVTVAKLRNPSVEAEALKRMAMGVGAYRNNPREELPNPYIQNTEAQQIAAAYCRQMGFPEPQALPYVKVNEKVAREIAEIFNTAPNDPYDEEVRACYAELIHEVKLQFDLLPVKIEAYSEGEPYKSSEEMMDDVFSGHLWVYDGGEDHAIFTRKQNFAFRAVHDYFGHAAIGVAFGPRGEENAWMKHSEMFSPMARAAMTTETRGQNSWVNYGPFSDLPPNKRPYAGQKVFLLPIEYQTRPELEAAYKGFPDFYPARAVAANRGRRRR